MYIRLKQLICDFLNLIHEQIDTVIHDPIKRRPLYLISLTLQLFKYLLFQPHFNYTFGFSHMWSLIKQLRIDGAFSAPPSRGGWLTVVVPSNSAWEKAQRDFSQAYTTLTQGGYPQYVSLNDPLSSKCKLK
jgi:hypothetical protein